MADKEKIMSRLQEHYEEILKYGYETVGIFLQGSQNYDLDYEDSDIDSKVIVIPKFDDFLFNKKPVSYTHIMENEEHVDLKDIRLMFQCFRKQNINFVEILFTDYYILNEKYEDIFRQLLDIREQIARYDIKAALNCMCGMAYEKLKALKHPYPSTIGKIEKFGYDPKQLHHILRIQEFITRYIAGEDYSKCLKTNKREQLLDVKRGNISIQEIKTKENIPKEVIIEQFAAKCADNIHDIKEDYLKQNDPLKEEWTGTVMNSILSDIIKRAFVTELIEEPGE